MKKTRLYINGKRRKDVYVGYTKLQVFSYYVGLGFRRLVRLSILAGAIWTGAYIVNYLNPTVEYRVEAKEVVIDTLKVKIDSLKNEVVDGIKNWETKGIAIPQCDGKIVFDTNHKASIGCYQYQVKTVQLYVKALEGRDISEAEAIAIATDHVKARALSYRIVWERNELSQNWYNYSRQVGTQQKLAMIKELEAQK